MDFIYTAKHLCAKFEKLTPSRLFQFRNGPDRAKQLLFEGEDFTYVKTKIKYSHSALDKLEHYYTNKRNNNG